VHIWAVTAVHEKKSEWKLFGRTHNSDMLFVSYDVALPAEVDDEYWSSANSLQDFQQPPGKPSYVTAFISRIKLSQITAFALRTVCANDLSQAALKRLDHDWRITTVTELNGALTKWATSVPQHRQSTSPLVREAC
jgi:hypothetical protein